MTTPTHILIPREAIERYVEKHYKLRNVYGDKVGFICFIDFFGKMFEAVSSSALVDAIVKDFAGQAEGEEDKVDGLLPCPLCGSNPHIIKRLLHPLNPPERYGVTCEGCELFLDERAKSKAEAIVIWNRRTDSSEVARLKAENERLTQENHHLSQIDESHTELMMKMLDFGIPEDVADGNPLTDLYYIVGRVAALTTENAKLRDALKPFGLCGKLWNEEHGDAKDDYVVHYSRKGYKEPDKPDLFITVGHLRRAAEAMKKGEKDNG